MEKVSLDELKERIEKLRLQTEYYNTMQLSAKTFINSVYGVFGTEFFNLSNTDIAESITLQGQDLIKFSVVEINDYVKNKWNDDIEGHKRIAEKMKSLFGDKFDYEGFLESAKTKKIDLETVQVYGDSVTGDSLICVDGGKQMTIEDMFNEVCSSDCKDKIRVKSTRRVLSMDLSSDNVAYRPILYIMRHHTNKHVWKIVSGNSSITCTEDHSILVRRNEEYVEVKPSDIRMSDKLIKLSNSHNEIHYFDVYSVQDLGEYNDYVYDISVDASDNEYVHNFFANNILVHNTDSVSADSIVRTEKHPEGIAIEDFYKENENTQCVEIQLDDNTIRKYNANDLVIVKREGKEMNVFASDILDTDEICIR